MRRDEGDGPDPRVRGRRRGEHEAATGDLFGRRTIQRKPELGRGLTNAPRDL